MPAKIIAPLITPRNADGSLNLSGLRSNLERLSQEPLDGYLALGSSGEYLYLDEDERREVISATLAGSAGRIVYVQVGGETTAKSLELAKWAMGQGASALLAVTPHYYTPQLRGAPLEAYYRELGAVGPTFVYHIPSYTGFTLDPEDILRLAGLPGIVGVKDSSGSLPLLVEILAGRPDGFSYFVGSGGSLAGALAHGADGTIAALANVLPAELRVVADRMEEGDISGAAFRQAPLARVNALITRKYGIPGLKYAAEKLGYASGPPVPPLQPLHEAGCTAIDNALSQAAVALD